MALTEDQRIRSSPRASKDPNSYEYARQMVYVLRGAWERTSFNFKHWNKELAEARKNKIWRNHNPAYDTIEDFLAAEVGYSDGELSRKIEQAKEAGPLQQAGGDRKSEEAKDHIRNTNMKTCTQDLTYTLRRLLRDKPKLFAKVEAGELSANAAAIEAGFRHPMIQVRADDYDAAIAKVNKHYILENK